MGDDDDVDVDVAGVFHSVVEALQGACVESRLCPEPTDPVEVPKYDKGGWVDRWVCV